MTGGYIQGGWGFVWTAYGVSFTILTVYGISLINRYRAERKRYETSESNSR